MSVAEVMGSEGSGSEGRVVKKRSGILGEGSGVLGASRGDDKV